MVTSMPSVRKYDGYKDSGYTWIGSIPESWEVERLKFHLKRNEPRNPGNKEVLSLYREYGVIPKDSRDDNHNVTSEDTSNYKYVQVGDFVVNKMKAWQGSVAVSEYEGIVSPAYYVYKFTDDRFDRKYFHYLMRGCYKEEFMRLSAGIRIGQWDLSSISLDTIPVLIPSIDEQRAISKYLDNMVSGIDKVLEDAKTSIVEYKEWKASTIHETVTRGVFHNESNIIESGVTWIGNIPSCWEMKKIKYVGKNITVRSADNVGYIGLENVESGSGRLVVEKQESVIAEGAAIEIKKGDVLFGKLRPYLAKCVVAENDGCCSTEFIVMRPINCEARYLKYVMLSPAFIDSVNMSTYGAKMPRANWDFIGNIMVPYPSIEEQLEISNYLDEMCEKINNIIHEKEQLILELEEYKKTLIYEVVTGKRKVV